MAPAEASAPIWKHPEFRRGARDMVVTSAGISSWAFVTGVAMVKGGLSVPIALLMNVLPLLVAGAPIWVVWATALCVNLRFVIFSAGFRPYFVELSRRKRMAMGYFLADLNYAIFMRRFPTPQDTASHHAYAWGGIAVNWPSWIIPSTLGILLGDQLPTSWGIGFAGTLALLGIAGSLLVDRATWVAAVVAACAAIAAWALPLKLNIIVAIAAAIAVGVAVHRWMPGPAAKHEA
jgi:predicted branched-subunit amino acid permease